MIQDWIRSAGPESKAEIHAAPEPEEPGAESQRAKPPELKSNHTELKVYATEWSSRRKSRSRHQNQDIRIVKIQTSESQLEISTADFKSQDCKQGVGSRPKFQRLNSKPRYQNSSSLRDLAVFVFPLEVV